MENQTTNQPAPSNNDVEQNKVMAILAYIIFFIPLLAAKDSAFAKYHANQGLWLFIIALVGYVVSSVLSVTGLGCCLLPIVTIAQLVYAILGIMNAANGQMKPLPGFTTLPVLIK